jgi:hypothetical protein
MLAMPPYKPESSGPPRTHLYKSRFRAAQSGDRCALRARLREVRTISVQHQASSDRWLVSLNERSTGPVEVVAIRVIDAGSR